VIRAIIMDELVGKACDVSEYLLDIEQTHGHSPEHEQAMTDIRDILQFLEDFTRSVRRARSIRRKFAMFLAIHYALSRRSRR